MSLVTSTDDDREDLEAQLIDPGLTLADGTFIPLDAVQVLHLEPGDTVILESPNVMSDATREEIIRTGRKLWPNVKVIVMDEGLSVAGILRPASNAESTQDTQAVR